MSNKFKLNKVVIRYFLSYMIILLLSISGLFYILHFQLRNDFNTTYTQQIERNTKHLATVLNRQFFNLFQINNTLSHNVIITSTEYSSRDYYDYAIQEELNKFLHATSLVDDIIYINTRSTKVYGFKYDYYFTDGKLAIRKSNDVSYEVLLSEIDSSTNTFKRLETDDDALLLFIPEQSSQQFFSIFIINPSELTSLLQTVMSSSSTDIVLRNNKNDYLLSSSNDSVKNKPNNDSEIFSTVHQCDYARLNVTNYYSDSMINERITQTFKTVYITLLIIFIVGCILIFIFTYFSYAPLNIFARFLYESNIDPTANVNSYFDLKYASKVFASIKQENDELLEKIKNYRLNMQKSLLSSIDASFGPSQLNSDSLDALFDTTNQKNLISVLHISTIKGGQNNNMVYESLCDIFPSPTLITTLNKTSNTSTYLLFISNSFISNHNINNLLESLVTKYNCDYRISKFTNNPMDISRLYEEVTTQTTKSSNMYELLDQLQTYLTDANYLEAKEVIHELFKSMNTETLPEFFVQTLLLDTLTTIVSFYNRANISFTTYSDYYYETLYLCRSNKFNEVQKGLVNSFLTLVNVFETESSNDLTLNKETFVDYTLKEFTNSNFSISQLGDHFQVSASYISYWFKKNFDEKFSDYLWSLRFNYTIELMHNPNLKMIDIAEKVGYDNYSSFRRKFKKTHGVSPAEYRKQINKNYLE